MEGVKPFFRNYILDYIFDFISIRDLAKFSKLSKHFFILLKSKPQIKKYQNCLRYLELSDIDINEINSFDYEIYSQDVNQEYFNSCFFLNISEALKLNTSIRNLNLDNCQVLGRNPENLKMLSQGLYSNNSIIFLNLDNIDLHFSSENMKYLSNIIEQSTSLKHITFEENETGYFATDIEYLSKAIVNTNLETIKFQFAKNANQRKDFILLSEALKITSLTNMCIGKVKIRESKARNYKKEIAEKNMKLSIRIEFNEERKVRYGNAKDTVKSRKKYI